MYNFSERLLEERKRLGLNQDQMAELGGIAKGTYFNYEAGKREPGGNFLAAIAEGGADVQYILTGIHNQQAVTVEPPANYAILTRKKLDKVVDDLSPEQQAELLKLAEEKRRLNLCEVELEKLKKNTG
jgi:transcriptional regulator with XRE-family HTH domain